jgi:hypothetical protein
MAQTSIEPSAVPKAGSDIGFLSEEDRVAPVARFAETGSSRARVV